VQPDGIVLVHISNRYIDLEPVLLALTERAGWHARLRYDEPNDADQALARTGSIWVAMARSEAPLQRLAIATEDVPDGRGLWRPLDTNRKPKLWTDSYASFLPLLMIPGFGD
jgi:hypothetical protein